MPPFIRDRIKAFKDINKTVSHFLSTFPDERIEDLDVIKVKKLLKLNYSKSLILKNTLMDCAVLAKQHSREELVGDRLASMIKDLELITNNPHEESELNKINYCLKTAWCFFDLIKNNSSKQNETHS